MVVPFQLSFCRSRLSLFFTKSIPHKSLLSVGHGGLWVTPLITQSHVVAELCLWELVITVTIYWTSLMCQSLSRMFLTTSVWGITIPVLGIGCKNVPHSTLFSSKIRTAQGLSWHLNPNATCSWWVRALTSCPLISTLSFPHGGRITWL